MTFAQFLFVAIDKMFDRSQNNKKMLRFKDVKFEIETDIAYDNDDACKLDTYYVKKDGNEKYPVFFYIHGGGFVAGDKHYRRGLAKWAANKGFFVVNVNYGLGPKYLFPKGLQHLVSALNWVGANAENTISTLTICAYRETLPAVTMPQCFLACLPTRFFKTNSA